MVEENDGGDTTVMEMHIAELRSPPDVLVHHEARTDSSTTQRQFIHYA